jgi:hypothetical protein
MIDILPSMWREAYNLNLELKPKLNTNDEIIDFVNNFDPFKGVAFLKMIDSMQKDVNSNLYPYIKVT